MERHSPHINKMSSTSITLNSIRSIYNLTQHTPETTTRSLYSRTHGNQRWFTLLWHHIKVLFHAELISVRQIVSSVVRKRWLIVQSWRWLEHSTWWSPSRMVVGTGCSCNFSKRLYSFLTTGTTYTSFFICLLYS